MSSHNRVTAAGILVALGIIYGDIGTSPLYVLNAIVNGKTISEELIVGSLSLIIWTLTLQTTIKYVILTLQADNPGTTQKKVAGSTCYDRWSRFISRWNDHSAYFSNISH
jgi:K+ transporter